MNENIIIKRLKVMQYVIPIIILVLVFRLYQLQIWSGDEFKKKAAENMLRLLPIEAPRGAVFDRHGKILVRNDSTFRVSIIPEEVKKRSEIIKKVAEILNIPIRDLENKLINSKNQFEPIKIKEPISYQELALLEEEKANLSGIKLEAKPLRRYLLGKTGAHFLGYIGEITEEELKLNKGAWLVGDTIGKDGIEKTYDTILKGKNGFQQIEVDVTGQIVQILEDLEPVPGNDLYLTIDFEVQKAAEEGLEKVLLDLQKINKEKTPGSVIAIDPRTGGILAHASAPGFDPNLFSRGITANEYKSILSERHYPMFNRVIAGAYPCGSTFKLVTGTAALEEKAINYDTPVYCNGVFYESGKPFYCFVRRGHGIVKAKEAMGQSCDVYYYILGHRLGIGLLYNYAVQFGIGQLTGVDLPGESPGLLPGEEWKKKTFPLDPVWYAGETINLSIGQGYLQVTPIQLAVVGSIVANSGISYKPHLFYKSINPNGALIKSEDIILLHKVNASPETFQVIREGMRAAVDHGTAVGANLKEVMVAGKTGTAENVPSLENKYGRNHAWFVCFAPLEKPEIVVVVCLEQSGGFGGQWAAPIARRVLEAYFKINSKKGR